MLQVSLRTLNLQILRTIASFTARPIFQPQQLLCTSGAFETAVEAFLDEARPLDQRIEKYANGLVSSISSISLLASTDCVSPSRTFSLQQQRRHLANPYLSLRSLSASQSSKQRPSRLPTLSISSLHRITSLPSFEHSPTSPSQARFSLSARLLLEIKQSQDQRFFSTF